MIGVVGTLRVKNEARWIEKCLRSILPICDRIHVFDDCSTDDTREIVRTVPGCILHRSPFRSVDEVRDKNLLLQHVDQGGGADWIVMIDGDEVLAPGGADKIQQAIALGRGGCLSLPILYLWDREDQARVDGVYGRFARESVFRYQGERFRATSGGGNFHCGNVPPAIRPKRVRVEAPLLHYGYMHREDRIRKYEWYNRIDPNNQIEDGYRHMVQGDLPQIRSTQKLRHAGPLTLQSLHTANH